MKRYLAPASLLLLAGLLFRAGSPAADRPSDLRDAPADRPALEALGGEAPAAPEASAPERALKAAAAKWTGGDSLVNGPSSEQRSRMGRHNRGLMLAEVEKGLDTLEPPVYSPFADYQRTGYLIMSADFDFDSLEAKRAAARTLGPEGVLVLLLSPYQAQDKESLVRLYADIIPRARIKTAALRDARSAFWARDAMPVPMLEKSGGAFVVIDAKYYHNFNSDQAIADMFGARLDRVDYYFEGGNFMANDRGDCIIVDAHGHKDIPDHIFARHYGCARLVRLPLIDGIGHIDEHARFVSPDTLLTDLPEYKDLLESKGFKVRMLPRVTRAKFATHVNSLIIDGKAAVPVYGLGTDQEALAAYEAAGFQAFPANSYKLSTSGQGSVHCITMTYPPVPFRDVLKAIGAEER